MHRQLNHSASQRNLLVTGGCGFIGCNFVRYWLKAHPADRVCVLDSLTYASNRSSLASVASHPSFVFVRGDIRDTDLVESLLLTHGINTIVHFAAESHVDKSISGPDVFIETNVVGTHSLLKAARKVWLEEKRVAAHRFHHVSTDEVYGSLGTQDAAFTEKSLYAPNSPYSASKAASDHVVRAYHHTYGLNTTISNCSNNYGPYQFPEKLIPLAIVNMLDGKSIPIYGDGRQVRDWLHAEDHVRAIDLVVTAGHPGETYNIGGDSEVENISLITSLCSIADNLFMQEATLRALFPLAPMAKGIPAASLIKHVTDRPGHDRRYAIDYTKLKSAFGYEPRWNITQGLVDTLRWYLIHEPWWRKADDDRLRSDTDCLGRKELNSNSE